jgi:hypothetical protein
MLYRSKYRIVRPRITRNCEIFRDNSKPTAGKTGFELYALNEPYLPFKDEAQTALFKRPSPYRAVNTFYLGYKKTYQFMLYGAKVAIYFETNTNHINLVWQNIKILIVKTVGASLNQQGLRDYSEGHKVIEFTL